MVKILGLGPGHEDYIIPKVIKELEKSDYIVGFERAISSLKFLNSINDERFKRVKGLKEIIEFLKENKEKRISIVASGDPTFYGITNYICKNYEGEQGEERLWEKNWQRHMIRKRSKKSCMRNGVRTNIFTPRRTGAGSPLQQ